MSVVRRRVATTALAGLAALLVAAPAQAHPSFNPNSVTVGERHTLDFVIPHGCTAGGGAPAGEEDVSPTIAVSVQVPSEVAFIGAHEAEGWTLRTSATAFTWSDAGGATTDPIVFQVDVELFDTPAELVNFVVAQDCLDINRSILWNDLSAEEGANPPAVLNVAAVTGNVEMDHGDAHGETDDAGAGSEGGASGEAGGDHEMTTDAMGEDGHETSGPAPLDGALVILTVVMVFGGIFGILKFA